MRRRQRAGFTVVETLMVLGILALLAALVWPALAGAQKAARRVTCADNLRQLGVAYQLYRDEYGGYPSSLSLTTSRFLPDRQTLFCPNDVSMALLGAASSYRYTLLPPPRFRPIWQSRFLDPMVGCEHHVEPSPPEAAGRPAPETGYHLVVRASGAVSPVPVAQVRRFHPLADATFFIDAYPGEPGYEQAER
jgi:type II secretory pathway pseudopilin PulG